MHRCGALYYCNWALPPLNCLGLVTTGGICGRPYRVQVRTVVGLALSALARLNGIPMIYQIHEMQHAALSPWRRWAELNAQLFGSPFSLLSYIPASKKVAAACELMLRITHRYEKPEFGLTETKIGKDLGVVVYYPLLVVKVNDEIGGLRRP